VWLVGENSPPKKSLVREPWFNVAPKTVLGGEPWGSRGCPKQVWAVFDFYKIKKKSPVREPWFNVAPKTVLVESRGSRGCPKLFWAVFDQTQKKSRFWFQF